MDFSYFEIKKRKKEGGKKSNNLSLFDLKLLPNSGSGHHSESESGSDDEHDADDNFMRQYKGKRKSMNASYLDSQLSTMLDVLYTTEGENEYEIGDRSSQNWRVMWRNALNCMCIAHYGSKQNLSSISRKEKAASPVLFPSLSPSPISPSKKVLSISTKFSQSNFLPSIQSPILSSPTNHLKTISSYLPNKNKTTLLQILKKVENELYSEDKALGQSSSNSQQQRKSSIVDSLGSKYGGTPNVKSKSTKVVLQKIGEILRQPDYKNYTSSALQRGKTILVGPNSLSAKLNSHLKLKLRPQEINLLMDKFDPGNTGYVNLIDIYGNSLNISKRRCKGSIRKFKIDSSSTLCSQSISLESLSLGSNTTMSGHKILIQNPLLREAFNKISVCADDCLNSKVKLANYSFIDSPAEFITKIEFKFILANLGAGLTEDEIVMIQRLYGHPSLPGHVKLHVFIQDFQRLGTVAHDDKITVSHSISEPLLKNDKFFDRNEIVAHIDCQNFLGDPFINGGPDVHFTVSTVPKQTLSFQPAVSTNLYTLKNHCKQVEGIQKISQELSSASFEEVLRMFETKVLIVKTVSSCIEQALNNTMPTVYNI